MLRPVALQSDRPYGGQPYSAADVWAVLDAADRGDTVSIRALLGRHRGLCRASYGYTEPLHLAVGAGHAAVVALLLDAGASPSSLSQGGEDLVATARERGYDDVVVQLLSARSAGDHVVPGGDHAIHRAADRDEAEAVRSHLLREPGLLEQRDSRGGTPLHRAVVAVAHRVIDVLLDHGADPELRHGESPGTEAGYAPAGFTALDLALWRGPFWNLRTDLDTLGHLLERGVEGDLVIAAAVGDLEEVRRRVVDSGTDPDQPRPCGKRALSTAIERGHEEIARFLLTHGADPCAAEGDTAPRGVALHAAARRGDEAMVVLLLAHGADPGTEIDSSGSAVYVAATPAIRRRLLAAGARLDVYDLIWLGEEDEAVRRVRADPRSADAGCGGVLAAACTQGKVELVARLLDAGARMPEVVTACRSYLWSDPVSLELLLDSGMDPDLPSWRRATPLHSLCGRDGRGRPRPHRAACATLLLDRGADLSARDDDYRSTPLGWAARNGLDDMVALLLARGAPLTLDDDPPWATPLTWARSRGHEEVLRRLRDAGARH